MYRRVVLITVLALVMAPAVAAMAAGRSGAGTIDIGWLGDKSKDAVSTQLPHSTGSRRRSNTSTATAESTGSRST